MQTAWYHDNKKKRLESWLEGGLRNMDLFAGSNRAKDTHCPQETRKTHGFHATSKTWGLISSSVQGRHAFARQTRDSLLDTVAPRTQEKHAFRQLEEHGTMRTRLVILGHRVPV